MPFRLSGSQAKTAFALRQNVENMIAGNAQKKLKAVEFWATTPDGVKELRQAQVWLAEHAENLTCCGFLTLTVGDWMGTGKGRKFVQVWEAKEASRRINNLNRRLLKTIFVKAIIVTERHKNGAIHFHIVGILRGRPDIRTGFDFPAFNALIASGRNFSAADVGACPELAALWKLLRDELPGFGFGRAQLTPIEKTGEAIACYVSKYIEKNICNRTPDDKRKKLVRYIGWGKQQLKPNEFSWATKRAMAWRQKTAACAALVGVQSREQAAEVFGPRWAWKLSGIWTKFDDSTRTFFVWDFKERELVRALLLKSIGFGAGENKSLDRFFERNRQKFAEVARDSAAFFQEKFPPAASVVLACAV